METILDGGRDASSQFPESEAWRQISPLLDDAMGRLGEKDRNAIVLRFFENKNLREVGLALGASEDAAIMRVNRALEKLRKFFTKRGVTHSAAIIAGAVSANSVHAAPVTLAKTISAVALAKGAAASTSTLTLIKGALKIMAWTKAKTAIVAAAAAILAAGTATPIVVHIVHQRAAAASLFTSKPELAMTGPFGFHFPFAFMAPWRLNLRDENCFSLFGRPRYLGAAFVDQGKIQRRNDRLLR